MESAYYFPARYCNAMASSSSSTSPRPEYQHFVPQFLLRNFAHPYKPLKNGPQRRRQPKQKGARTYPGDPVVNNVNLLAEPLAIEETLVKRILGINDMYQDTSQPTAKQQRHIESLFGKLESEASPIFRKIVKSFEKGDPGVWITRVERDRIRKFLFLLKYRGSTFHRRFYHVNASDYDCNDQVFLHKYMREKGFERPVDVWFNNIKVIAELDMDVEDKWISHLFDNIYPRDAAWFLSHVQMMYMAICSPSDPSAEFILTDNSYNVWEGVNSFVPDPKTGGAKSSHWVNFHEFAPISPKLTIVLRNFIMPVSEEDSHEDIKEQRALWRNAAVDSYFGPGVESALKDLPIQKPRNNYSEIVNGRVRLIKDDWRKNRGDKFCFRFFRIGMEHVNKINDYMLDNARFCTTIIFGSKDNFVRSLEWYMTEPCLDGKVIVGEDADQRLKLIKNLAVLMKSLGSTAEPIWNESPQTVLSEFEKMQLMNEGLEVLCEEMTEKLKDNLGSQSPTEYMHLYTALGMSSSVVFFLIYINVFLCTGGSTDTFFYDLEQSRRMLHLRIKLDSWSQGVPEFIRTRNRELLIDTYMRLSSSRVWLFSQRVKLMVLNHNKDVDIVEEQKRGALPLDSPEGIIADSK